MRTYCFSKLFVQVCEDVNYRQWRSTCMKVWTVERSENVVISCILYIDKAFLKVSFTIKLPSSFLVQNWLGAWEWGWWCRLLMCGQCIGDRTCTVGSVLVQHVLQYLCWSCRREHLCQLPFPSNLLFQAPPISFSVLWKPSGSGNRASLIILLLCRRENNSQMLILDGHIPIDNRDL